MPDMLDNFVGLQSGNVEAIPIGSAPGRDKLIPGKRNNTTFVQIDNFHVQISIARNPAALLRQPLEEHEMVPIVPKLVLHNTNGSWRLGDVERFGRHD